ncbi:glycosyltransferase [Patescibacteria group bacterium]|nr:glycosyltransferase [Patescibacteria group bacterium]
MRSTFFCANKDAYKYLIVMNILNKTTSRVKRIFVNPKVEHIKPRKKGSMIGAGVKKLEKEFITHTTLIHHKSAVHTFVLWQKLFLSGLVGIFLTGLALNWLLTLQLVVAILTVIYFIDVLFNLFLVLKSLHLPPELDFDDKELTEIKDIDLPIYTILCPMYKEAKIIPSFLEAISKLDWPKNKLDVQLLLEEDDLDSIHAAKNWGLPSYVRAIIVPHSQPKTKPKACNYGLNIAKGEYLVIYDAEDIPDPKQLKKAYLAFQSVDKNVVCLQAKLNYFNPHQNFITRLFTAEYSLWFDVVLPGLQGINTNIPLGGTSNHFRIDDLKTLEGWDPFNVTEDCDLGVRLFMEGKKTAVINSTTLEEANSKFKNWLRQRSRWIKGYMQTYLVHMRNPYQLVKKQGIHALFFNLIVGGKIAFMFINPFLWLATIGYFVLHAQLGAIIESLYPSYIFYMALFSLVFGNFLYMFYYMIGCAKRGHWSVIKYVYLVPFYWIMTSIAAVIALQQLFFKPHYWEKTVHGLHNSSGIKERWFLRLLGIDFVNNRILTTKYSRQLFNNRRLILSGFGLVGANLVTNALNFAFNLFLGKNLSFENYGIVSLFTSLMFISSIPLSALSSTVAHKSALLFGKYSKNASYAYFLSMISKTVLFAVLGTVLWIVAIPFMKVFFHIDSVMPFFIFTPVWAMGVIHANFNGYLKGTLAFWSVASMIFIESVVKLLLAIILVFTGNEEWVYLSIPVGMLCQVVLIVYLTLKNRPKGETVLLDKKFNFRFYVSAMFSNLYITSFLAIDVILAKHYLNANEAGQYALLNLVGKMVYFAGSLLFPFIIPIVSKNAGANKSSREAFIFLFGLTAVLLSGLYLTLGVFGWFFAPLVFGEKTLSIVELLPIYLLAISIFAISIPSVSYFQARGKFIFTWINLLTVLFEIGAIFIFHSSLNEFVVAMFLASTFNVLLQIFAYLFRAKIEVVFWNLYNIKDLFSWRLRQVVSTTSNSEKLKILIFNWRDTKHVWGGGAESYIHELAKRWVKEGNGVTLFCGNDGRSSRNDLIDGVNIIRRGGFYTVYFWAFVYYVFKFRGKFDVVVDSENGLPFFTPLYVRIPKFLLIHHIHQEVFRLHLKFPFKNIAMLLESKLMPLVYHNQRLITVSESSKKEILKMRLSKFRSIEIINPGINSSDYQLKKKTNYVSILYLGRLKPYKNVDVALRAFAEIIKIKKDAIFYIAGVGDSLNQLKELAESLGISNSVKFLGRVSDEEKSDLLASCWLMIQPSMIEGWGITVIEANASGTPVVASNVNGLKDSIVDNVTGLLVKPSNYNDLAQKTLILLQNKRMLEKFSNQANKWSKKFSWDLSARAFLNQLKMDVAGDDLSKVDQRDSHFNKNYASAK